MANSLRYALFDISRGWIAAVKSGDELLEITLPQQTRESALGKLKQNLTDATIDEASFSTLADKLKRFFNGEEVVFNEPVSLKRFSAFDKAVLEVTAAIPYGQTISYGELAARAGSPLAARAAGQAMKKNPLPVIIPCHRVIRGNGNIGGYNGNLDLKRGLLRNEGVKITL